MPPSRAARNTLTWSVILAASPNDSKMCRVMLVGYTGPMYGASSGSSCTTYGRPDTSTAARQSTSSIGMVADPYRRMPAFLQLAGYETADEMRDAVTRYFPDLDLAGAVEVDLDQHLGLLGDALHPRGPTHEASSISAARNASVSPGVPAVTRSQPARPTSRISTPRSSNRRQTIFWSPPTSNSTKLASLSATR